MPAIRKIRIVNFRFNDGSKYIPDEVFYTEDSEGKPIDTLLNLDNGGGKSVIVQLLLQPVCPKAKVQNRNISDYFQKGNDHAFVLIEWALDNSSNSLLTGIALAASTTADDETGSKTVRYYTFIHDYTKTGDKLDLINLPLTERTENHIHALSFDELRKYLQNRKVEYYPSDSLRRYQKRLEEYGIFHAEWENLIVRINAVEDGIPKFFEEYRSSDRLLDRFIIPGVMPDDKASSEEIEEMFLNYAESYAGQADNILLQSQIAEFSGKLQGILPFIKDMWTAEDSRLQSIHLLGDYLLTLEHNIKKFTENQQNLQETISSLKAKLHHIQAEKASQAYYIAKDKYDTAQLQLKECVQKKDEAKKRQKQFEHMVNTLNAAKEYSELLELQNQESALSAQLREIDRGTQNSHILSLKYSLAVSAEGLMQQTYSKLRLEEENHKKYDDTLQNINTKISQLSNQLYSENNSLNMTKGRRDTLHEQIENVLKALKIRVTFMLDGRYSVEDIANIRAEYDSQIKLAEDKINSFQNEEKQIMSEIEGQDQMRDSLAIEQADSNTHLKNLESELNQYRKAYDAAVSVLEHLSVSEESLFSDEPLSALSHILENLSAELKQTEHSAELLSEQVRCIETGQLHLSKTAVSFLQETDIPYQTGEQYLNYQSAEIREKILSVNPLTAYSVIVNSENERLKLLSQPVDIWLSSIVPVYTRSEAADMADGKWNSNNHFLSAFDREYFDDVSTYKEHIRQKLDDTNTLKENLCCQIREWQSEQQILLKFTYSADYEGNLKMQIEKCNAKLQNIRCTLSELDKKRTSLRENIDKIHNFKYQQQELRRCHENNKNEFERICGIISEYEKLSIKAEKSESECRQLSQQIDYKHLEENKISDLLEKCGIEINQLSEKAAEYRSLLDELKDTPKATLLSEEYSVMLAEYGVYKQSYSSDRQRLQQQLKLIQESIRKKEKDIHRFNIPDSEYQNITYSDEAYNYASEQLNQAEKNAEQTYKQYIDAEKYHTKTESLLNQSKTRLAELHTQLLERSEVGSDFERRSSECQTALDTACKNHSECVRLIDELSTDKKYTVKYAARFEDELQKYTPKVLTQKQDTNNIQNTIENALENLKQAENKTKDYHRHELEPFRNTRSLFAGTLDGIISVIDNHNITGDKYFTLYERTEDDIRRYKERTEQLSVLLRDVEDSRKQLVTNCLQRIGRLYENLTILSKKSTIQIGNVKRQMIKIDLPEIEPASTLPSERINTFITEQVKKYLAENRSSQKTYNDYLEIRKLLNCYIGKETIPIYVFKIDKNLQNSRYRLWQDALKANSGGEQFVVLFSLVVSVMNYTRSLAGSLNHTSGVLILDNPFGPISSPHLLEPMFRIARHFHIQLICLTHLGTADVTSFFNMVYQLRFRTPPLSNLEILESEAKQHMEHAYYRTEQLSLF